MPGAACTPPHLALDTPYTAGIMGGIVAQRKELLAGGCLTPVFIIFLLYTATPGEQK